MIHIPKTAGTSIATVAHQYGIAVKGHDIRSRDFVPLKDYDRDSMAQYHLFTIVRNPWDRVVSSFHYLETGGRNVDDRMDWEKYIRPYEGNFSKFIKEEMRAEKVLTQLHFIPQYEWIYDGEDKLVDTILKFEDLEHGIKKLFSKASGREVVLPRINTTDHRHYREYYDDDAKEIVKNAYRKDVELFNYIF